MAKVCEIEGGVPLRGSVTPIPNKNSLMSALSVAAITDCDVLYNQVPETTDVEAFLGIYEEIGAKVKRISKDRVLINAKSINAFQLNLSSAGKMRSSFMLAGPLLARFGQAKIPLPGGCKLGARAMSAHINAFKQFGISAREKNGYLEFIAPKKPKKKYDVWLIEASVTATANAVLYAVGRGIEADITDAACEPHICDILKMLEKMGANISGIGTNKIQVRKTGKLGQGEFVASPDQIDIIGHIAAAALTKGRIIIRNANIPDIVNGLLNWFGLFGVNIQRSGKDLIVDGKKSDLKIEKLFFPLAGRDLPKFVVRPWPGFPVDGLPAMVVLACCCQGAMLFKNWMYESGFSFVEELNFMGAGIYVSDPEKIIVLEEAIEFSGGEVFAPRVIEGTKALFLAALAAKGKTIIHGVDILRRRYPDIFEVYKKLGAKINIFEDKLVRR